MAPAGLSELSLLGGMLAGFASSLHCVGMCGGIAGFQCENEGDYCAMALGECERVADAAGVCTPRPEICTMDYRPVCGCDGETYSNPCAAAAKGVNIAYRGMCMD